VVARDEAEEHFETYLASRGIAFEYELPAGDSNPDYWLAVSGAPVCEVCHVTASMSDLPNRSGAFDAYKPLAKAIKRKSSQGRALEGSQPYVVVVWAPQWVDDAFVVMGALFGKVQIVMPFDSATGSADMDQASMDFGRDATLHASQRRHISAVAVIHRFNPRPRAAQDELDALRRRGASPEEGVRLTMEVFGRRAEQGLLDDDSREPRLVTFHNMYAATPLALDIFDGPFDEQYSISESAYERVFAGTDVDRLPT
jgi:hypothetical protein